MGTKRKSSSSSTPKLQPEPQKPKSPSSEEEEEEEEVEYEEEEVEYEEESEPESEQKSEAESEADDGSTKQESIRKLLEPFSKDQIIHLFKTAATSNDPSILSRVTSLADADPTHRKIFVRGLEYDATSEQLLDAFKIYGEIEECKLITDKVTGRAKGYGFVLFKSRVGSKRALKEPQKRIGNRTTTCHLAALGSAGSNQDSSGRKIYVGNVGADVESERLRAFFARFGEIEEGPFGIDSVSRKFKGYAIFVYRTVEGANKALEEPQKLFDGCQLFCKKFVENLNNASGSSSNVNQSVQQNEMSYGYGVPPGILGGAGMNGVPILMGQGMGFGMNPLLASGFNPSFGGIGAGYGIYGISPVVVGSYGSDPALQGLGTYQGAQLWQPSYGGSAAMATITTPAKDSSGGGGVTYPSSLGR